MAQMNHLFALPKKEPPTQVPSKDFAFSAKIPSRYLTENIVAYCCLKEAGYRMLSSLCFDSYCFTRNQRP